MELRFPTDPGDAARYAARVARHVPGLHDLPSAPAFLRRDKCLRSLRQLRRRGALVRHGFPVLPGATPHRRFRGRGDGGRRGRRRADRHRESGSAFSDSLTGSDDPNELIGGAASVPSLPLPSPP